MAPSPALNVIMRLWNPRLEATEVILATVVHANHAIAAGALCILCVAFDSPSIARIGPRLTVRCSGEAGESYLEAHFLIRS